MVLYKGLPVYNRLIVFVISLLFGTLGIDRIYLKEYKSGLIKFITLGGLGAWYILDLFHICIGQKLGKGDYIWSCEIPNKKMNCAQETHFIITALKYIVAIMFIYMMFFYTQRDNIIVLQKDDPYEPITYSN
jgi:TM2 domain-containing membrane protein YozV